MFNRLLWTILISLTFVKIYTLMMAQDWNMSKQQYKGHAVTPCMWKGVLFTILKYNILILSHLMKNSMFLKICKTVALLF